MVTYLRMNIDELLRKLTGFDWDDGNADKNWDKHQVLRSEAEEVFFHHPLIVGEDGKHSNKERRYAALGTTALDRLLLVVFTVRKMTLIQVISARDMSRKERKAYEKASQKENS